jgi:RNA polymerase sigma factor (sigma-70 family)
MEIFKAEHPNKTHETEASLWSQLKNGEKAGLEGIYVKFSPELFRYGMAIKSNRSFIKDCIQELFIDLWKYRHSIKQTDNVKLYLFRSLSNKICKEVARDKKRYLEDEISSHNFIFVEDSVEDRFISIQRNEKTQLKLFKALEGLPARQRQVIQHLFFENDSYEDTSKIMGINIESIYTLAWKAICSLKKSILFLVFLQLFQLTKEG